MASIKWKEKRANGEEIIIEGIGFTWDGGKKVSDPGDMANMEESCRYSILEEIKIV